MNTLKPLAILAVLGGIGYAVYTRVQGDHSHDSLETASPWGAPSVEIPGQGGAPGSWQWPAGGAPTSNPPGMAPPTMGSTMPAMPGQPSFNVPPSSPPVMPPLGTPGLQPTAPGTGVADYNAPPLAPPGGGLGAPLGTNPPTNNIVSTPTPGMPPGGSSYGPTSGSYPNSVPGLNPTTPDPAAAPAAPNGEMTFAAGYEAGRRLLDEGKLVEGLKALTVWYDDPRLSLAEQEQLNSLLDQVAGTVVYSTQHLLEPPYTVQPGDRMDEIGFRHDVPWQLIAKINGISDPQTLKAGDVLKMVKGPFMAVVSLDKCRLTLMLNGCYAGRFTIGMGRDYPLREGQYAVVDKVVNPTYRGLDRAIDADDPNNPLGERWIGLGSQLGIHGTNDPSSLGLGAPTLPAGCVAMTARDIDDVYDILSIGSKVLVRR